VRTHARKEERIGENRFHGEEDRRRWNSPNGVTQRQMEFGRGLSRGELEITVGRGRVIVVGAKDEKREGALRFERDFIRGLRKVGKGKGR